MVLTVLYSGHVLAQGMALGAAPGVAADAQQATEAAVAAVASAADSDAVKPAKWVLGATAGQTPTYAGSAQREWGIRPVLAFRVGRWMVSTSSARRLENMPLAGGISTTVVDGERWRVGVGARLTQGRSASDGPLLMGMPNIDRSLAIRAAASYRLAPEWSVSADAQQALQHGQGLRLGLGLSTQRPLPMGWKLDAGAGVTWANAQAMQTFYGVTSAQALPQRPAWSPGAGIEQWHWGVGVSRALSTHWRFMASGGRSVLLGDAARSPLTQQRAGSGVQFSLAYVGW